MWWQNATNWTLFVSPSPTVATKMPDVVRQGYHQKWRLLTETNLMDAIKCQGQKACAWLMLYSGQPWFLCYDRFYEMRSFHSCSVSRLWSSLSDKRMTSLNVPSERKQVRNESSFKKRKLKMGRTVFLKKGWIRQCSLNISYSVPCLTGILFCLSCSMLRFFKSKCLVFRFQSTFVILRCL